MVFVLPFHVECFSFRSVTIMTCLFLRLAASRSPEKTAKLSENYSHTALLLLLFKIYKRILSHLLKDLNTKVEPEKVAFCPEHSTTLLLTGLAHHLSENYNNDVQITNNPTD